MLEARSVVGGAAVTEEFHPGFRNSTASYTVSLLNPKVIRDMRLYRARPEGRAAEDRQFPADRGADYLLAGRGGLTKREIARHSPRRRRAITMPIRPRSIRSSACCASGSCARRPMPAAAWATCSPLLKLGGGVGPARAGEAAPSASTSSPSRPPTSSAAISRIDLVQALFGFDAVVGHYASPYAPGTRLCPPPPRVRRGGGRRGRLGPCDRRHGRDHPGDGQGGARGGRRDPPRRAGRGGDRREGRAAGAVAGGKAYRAKAVVAGVHPKLLFTRLLPEGAVAAEPARRMAHWASESATFRMNVALVRAAALHRAARARRPAHRRHHRRALARLHGPRLPHRAHRRLFARAGRRDADPLDARRQPRARRAATSPACSASISPIEVQGGWDARRDEAADHIIAHVDRYAPGFKAVGDRPAGAVAARSRAPLRPDRRRHLPRQDGARPALLEPADARPRRLPDAAPRASICAAPAPIPAAASPARPGTMRPARCSPTKGS